MYNKELVNWDVFTLFIGRIYDFLLPDLWLEGKYSLSKFLGEFIQTTMDNAISGIWVYNLGLFFPCTVQPRLLYNRSNYFYYTPALTSI